MSFKEQAKLRRGFAVILDRFGISVRHTKVNMVDSTTAYYSDPTITESTTTWYTAVFTERNQNVMMERYGEYQHGDCEFSFNSDAGITVEDFIETDSRKYQVRGIEQRQDGNIVYQDIWARLIKE